MTGKERILRALRREEVDCVPTFEWFIDQEVGRVLTGHTDPIEIVDALDIDGINIRPDYTREHRDERTFVDEWGVERRLTADCIPAVTRPPIAEIGRHADYAFPDPAAPHRFQTLERAIERFGDRRAIILNLRDGFSDTRDLLGYEEALMQLLLAPEDFAAMLDRVAEYNLALGRIARERYGMTIVATTDDVANASGPLFPPDAYFRTIGPAFRKVMQGFKDMGYRIIKHCDGDPSAFLDFWLDCGIDCLDPIDPAGGFTMGGMKARYGDRICLKGNVDCTGDLCDGTADDVALEVRDVLRQGGPTGLILSSSNTIHRGVKPANYLAMLEALREYGDPETIGRLKRGS